MKKQKFTVLLLYPWEQGGEQVGTYLAHVTSHGRNTAVLAATRELAEVEPWTEGEHVQVLALFKGHHDDITPDYCNLVSFD